MVSDAVYHKVNWVEEKNVSIWNFFWWALFLGRNKTLRYLVVFKWKWINVNLQITSFKLCPMYGWNSQLKLLHEFWYFVYLISHNIFFFIFPSAQQHDNNKITWTGSFNFPPTCSLRLFIVPHCCCVFFCYPLLFWQLDIMSE